MPREEETKGTSFSKNAFKKRQRAYSREQERLRKLRVQNATDGVVEVNEGGMNAQDNDSADLMEPSNFANLFDDDDNEDNGMESADGDDVEEMKESEYKELDEAAAKVEFKQVVKKWYNWRPEWKKLYPNTAFSSPNPHPFDDLMHLDIKPLMDEAITRNGEKKKLYGLIPAMCAFSVGQLGAVTAQSFAERMNSAGNNLSHDKNVNLDDDLIEKMVVIKMNECFIEFVSKRRETFLPDISTLDEE